MFVLAKTHAAVVAAKDAEIAGLMKRIGTLLDTQRTDGVRIRGLKDRCNDLWTAKDAAEAKLAVFTAPRARDARGHFVSAKAASA